MLWVEDHEAVLKQLFMGGNSSEAVQFCSSLLHVAASNLLRERVQAECCEFFRANYFVVFSYFAWCLEK